MKRIALLLAATAVSAPAFAADIIYDEPYAPAAPAVAAPVAFESTPLWTGFYVGGQAGAAFNPDSGPFELENSGFSGSDDDSDAGFIGGAHVGYDYQINSLILGAVADISYIDAESRSSYDIAPGFGLPGGNVSTNSEIDFVGTVRAKAGVAVDRFAVYATGGLAYADVDSRISGPDQVAGPGGVYNVSYDEDSDDVGYAVGAGVDYLATDNLSLGVEYLYTDLGSSDFEARFTPVAGGAGSTFSTSSSNDLDYHTVWAKASFRFN